MKKDYYPEEEDLIIYKPGGGHIYVDWPPQFKNK